MAEYRFKAKDHRGKKIGGTVTASGKKAALDLLNARNLAVIDLKEQRLPGFLQAGNFSALLKSIGYRQYTSRDLMIFCRQLATMLQAGISVLHSLYVLSAQMENKVFRNRLKEAAYTLEQGGSFSDSLQGRQGFFPPLLINMAAAGEASGRLDSVMEKMADHYEKQHDLEAKIRSATAYPLFITVVAFVVVAVMIVFVLPQFAGVFASLGVDMPLFSRLLLELGRAATGRWPLLLVLLLCVFAALARLARTEKGRFKADQIRLRLPLFGKIYNQALAARFARTLGTLLASGITLHEALQLVDKVIGNTVISGGIGEISKALNRGENMAGPMQANSCFPPLLGEMVRIGEETGALDQTLAKTAVFYEREVSYVVERLGTILEPALLLMVGLFIGLLVFSVLTPMYQVFQMI